MMASADVHGIAVIVAGAGLVAVLGVTFRWLRRSLLEDYRESVRDVVRGELRPLCERLHKIEAEFKPNGGESLRDSNDRTELRVARIEKHLDLNPVTHRSVSGSPGVEFDED